MSFFYSLFLSDLETILTRQLNGNSPKIATTKNGKGGVSKCRAELLKRSISNYLSDNRQDFTSTLQFAPPQSRTQQQALEWFSKLSPENRTIQVGYLYADRMERTERHADRIANG